VLSILWLQKISTARKVNGNSEGRWGCQNPKFCKESEKLNWNFQKGGGIKTKKNFFWWGGGGGGGVVDIFPNNTLYVV